MAHSHEQTYIARLGFADPDKRESRHDLAQRYLCLHQNVKKLAGAFPLKEKNGQYPDLAFKITNIMLERPISKGSSQYKTTVGFIDLAFTFNLYESIDGGRLENWDVFIEIKASRLPVTEIIRQVKFYREYIAGYPLSLWGVVTLYDLSTDERTALLRENIRPFRLGNDFELFCQQSTIENPESDPFADEVVTI